jgi:phosphate transport system permease protein
VSDRGVAFAGTPASALGESAVGERQLSIERRNLVRAAADRSLGRRRSFSRFGRAVCLLALAAALVPLVAEISYTAYRGIAGISLGFFVHDPRPPSIPGGGIASAIVGSATIIALALAMAVPVGVLAALFLRERGGRFASSVRFAAGVMTGVPSIVVGIFAYAVIVRLMQHPSDFAAGFAIAVLMLPIMLRANEEAMRAVPTDLWEAGIALGARRARVERTVVLRGALPGLVVGNLLALARGVGETAPLLFTIAAPTAAMTLLIYSDGTEPFASAQQTAWATALVLLAFVLILSVAARLLAAVLTRHAR